MQPTLFDQPKRKPKPEPSPPHSGSETSKAAAESVKASADALVTQVYEFIVSKGDHGATDLEIQEALGLQGDTERPRRWTLEKAKLIRNSGRTRPTPKKRQAVVWIATNLAKRS